jgi:hypothetical protein
LGIFFPCIKLKNLFENVFILSITYFVEIISVHVKFAWQSYGVYSMLFKLNLKKELLKVLQTGKTFSDFFLDAFLISRGELV